MRKRVGIVSWVSILAKALSVPRRQGRTPGLGGCEFTRITQCFPAIPEFEEYNQVSLMSGRHQPNHVDSSPLTEMVREALFRNKKVPFDSN